MNDDPWEFWVSNTDCYANNLPDGITIETVEKIEEYNSDFVQASVKAFGNLAIRALANEPDLDMVIGNVKLPGNNMFQISFDGLVEYNGELKYGLTHVQEYNPALNNPELTKVYSELSKLALEKLEGKVIISPIAIEDF